MYFWYPNSSLNSCYLFVAAWLILVIYESVSFSFLRKPREHQLTNAETTELLDQLTDRMDYRVRPNVDGESKLWCFYVYYTIILD